MTKYIKYHKNYTEFGEPYQLVLPLNLEGLVPNDDSVRLLSHELEDLNYSLLYQAYSAKGRNPAVNPKTMFKILIYAYSQNIYFSRKIETACKRDINFMWLLAGQKAPDHSTIARFRTGFLADACEDLFYQMVRRLEQMNELKPLFIKKQRSKSGYESEVTVYECEDCTGCPHKERCTRAKGNKRLYISKSFLKKRQESYENILSEKGILYRMNRSIQVEGAFGVLKNDYEFQRFLLRGKTKVKLEILLLCMGYNWKESTVQKILSDFFTDDRARASLYHLI